MFRLSQQTGISVADSAGAFARFAVAAKEVGATNDQVLRLVGGLQKAGIVAGASAEETGAATQQLAQALASGVLQGDELRSLLENMPQLAQALAKELGVGIGQLRQMGSEGKLTADRVLPALIAAGEKLAAEFDKLPPTMGRAFGVLGAAMDNFASQLDKALGLSQAIAKAAMDAAAAVNAVQRYVAPTDRQSAENDVARTRARLDALRAGPAMDDGSDPSRGYSAVQRAQLQAAATARQSALRQAESEHRAANDRLGEIERDAQQQRFGEYVTAQAKAADAARTRTAQEVREVVEANDKKLKAKGYPIALEHDVGVNIRARHWRIALTDAANPSGYVELARLWMGPLWAPQRNLSYGAGLTWEARSVSEYSLGGVLFSEARPPARVLRLTLNALNETEAYGTLLDAQRRVGTDGEVWVIPNWDDAARRFKRDFLARFRRFDPIAQIHNRLHETSFELEERL